MNTRTMPRDQEDLDYPDSDGQPMSDNTLQFQWIVTIQGNLDGLYANNDSVFVAGDILWYPVQGSPAICTAPDTLVAFGRQKGYRGSYRQWREGGIAPQVVFEIRSPGNTDQELERKFGFYDRYGVDEYYLYDPDHIVLSGWLRQNGRLEAIETMHGWVSPRLGILFDLSGEELVIYRPDGQRFLTFVELIRQKEEIERQAQQDRKDKERAERKALQDRRDKEEAERKALQDRRDKEEAERKALQDRRDKEEAERKARQDRRDKEEAERKALQDRRDKEEAERVALQERRDREEAEQKTTQEQNDKVAAQARAERLAAQLRALGIEPGE